MNNDQVIWTMITTYLADYYASANVFLGYQNYYAAPVADEFIILTKLLPKQRFTPNRYYKNATQEKVLWGYNDIEYQVDLYGTVADVAMNALYTILGSVVGSNFLRAYNMGIGKVGEPKNLTNVNDRDNYMTRYTLLFTVLANTRITAPMSGIGLEDITVNLKEYT